MAFVIYRPNLFEKAAKALDTYTPEERAAFECTYRKVGANTRDGEKAVLAAMGAAARVRLGLIASCGVQSTKSRYAPLTDIVRALENAHLLDEVWNRTYDQYIGLVPQDTALALAAKAEQRFRDEWASGTRGPKKFHPAFDGIIIGVMRDDGIETVGMKATKGKHQ